MEWNMHPGIELQLMGVLAQASIKAKCQYIRTTVLKMLLYSFIAFHKYHKPWNWTPNVNHTDCSTIWTSYKVVSVVMPNIVLFSKHHAMCQIITSAIEQ